MLRLIESRAIVQAMLSWVRCSWELGQPVAAAQVCDGSANGQAWAVDGVSAQRSPSELGPNLTPTPSTCIQLAVMEGKLVGPRLQSFQRACE